MNQDGYQFSLALVGLIYASKNTFRKFESGALCHTANVFKWELLWLEEPFMPSSEASSLCLPEDHRPISLECPLKLL